MKEVTIPSTGFAMSEALLLRWYKQPGDPVVEGESIAEIETDKTTAELESPCAGTIGPHLAEEGTLVSVGEPITTIIEATDAGSIEERPMPALAVGSPGVPEPLEDALVPDSTARDPRRLTPRQRSGIGATAAPSAQETPEVADGADTGADASTQGYREVIGAKVTESWRTIPHFAATRVIRADSFVAVRAERRQNALVPPSITDLLLRSLALAAKDLGVAVPWDIGLAVATDRGVVVPVLRGVLDLDLDGLTSARLSAIERAKAGRLLAADLAPTPHTTLSNLGPLGIRHFTGIIAAGQTSLITIGQIFQNVVPAGDGFAVEPSFNATVNVDHRAYDGADAARLLSAFARVAEDRERLGW
jgi:pyruvate dehydrogenase E2 component (dihydrolipoamide acetyltransferase)